MRCVARTFALLLALVAGSVMTTTALAPLLTRIGNPPVSDLWSIWQPWPQDDLWDVLVSGHYAESIGLSRYYSGYPEIGAGSLTSTEHYSSADLQRFTLVGSELFFRWRPSRPDGGAGTDLYQSFALVDPDSGDGESFVRAEIEGGPGALVEDTDAIEFPDLPGNWEYGRALTWDPSGTYMAQGGGGSDPGWVVIYKWVDGELTFLGDLPDMPYNPYEILALAWDDTGTYLLAGHSHYEGVTLSLYKRDGDDFTRLADPPNVGTSTEDYILALDWRGDYLAIGLRANASPQHGLAVYEWDSAEEEFTPLDSVGLNDVYGVHWTSDGQYLAAIHWITGTDWDPYVRVYSWDGASLTELEDSPLPAYYGEAVAWDPTDQYLAVGQYDTEGDALLLYKRVGDSVSLVFTATPDTIDVGSLGWHPTLPLLIAGHYDGSTNNPAFSWWERDGDDLIELSPPLDQPDPDTSGGSTEAVAWRPQGGVVVGGFYTSQAGPWMILYRLSGLVIRLSAGAWGEDDEWEAPYSEALHGWIRFLHDPDTNAIYLYTAGTDCAGWVERLAFPTDGEPAMNLGKLALEAEAWVVTDEDDEDEPSLGFYGPLNPRPESADLYLLTGIEPLPPVGGNVFAILPLPTEIEGATP